LDAAEAIGAGEGLERYQILDLLTQLVNKSLVIVEQPQTGEARYRLLDTIHQYAREKLAATAEHAAVRQRHLLFYLQLAERAEPELQQSEQAVWFDRLEIENDNLRAALDWACLTNAEAGLKLGGALRQFWTVRSYWNEGREWLRRILALPAAQVRTTARAKAINSAAFLAQMQDDTASAERLYEESIAIWRERGDTNEGLLHALRVYGNLVHDHHDRARGRALIEESIAIARAAGNQTELAWSLFSLGLIMLAEEQPDAVRTLEESLALHRAVQNPTGLALVLGCLGEDALNRGELERSLALVDESLYFCRQARDKHGLANGFARLARVAWLQHDLRRAVQMSTEGLALARELILTELSGWLLSGLGWMALQQKDTGSARQSLVEALELLHGSRKQEEVAFCLGGIAGVAAASGQFERAAVLWGKVNALGDLPPWPPIAPDIERLANEIQSHLSADELAAARSKGQAMSDEAAITYALNTDKTS
jgi:hypothetical protein